VCSLQAKQKKKKKDLTLVERDETDTKRRSKRTKIRGVSGERCECEKDVRMSRAHASHRLQRTKTLLFLFSPSLPTAPELRRTDEKTRHVPFLFSFLLFS
jgi:hypothetical protein